MTAFKFPIELLAQDIAIVGRKGSGKTYAAKGFVETLLANKRRVCIIDPTGVWWGLKASADGRRAGFSIVVFGGAHADVAINERSGAALARVVATTNLPCIIDLSEMLIGDRHAFMTAFAETVHAENRMALHLVIDEADEFAPQNPMPETKRMLHQIDRIVRRGRVRGFRVMLITQRPAVLHKNVLSQCNTLVAMRLTAPQDRNAMNAWVEGQADKDQAKEVLGTLARLQRGEGWVWAPEIEVLARTAFPRLTTYDSSRSPEDDEVLDEPKKLAAVDLSEITASFAAVEREARTVEELKAELAKLRKQGAHSKPVVDETEIQMRVAAGVERALKALPAQQGPLITGEFADAVDKLYLQVLAVKQMADNHPHLDAKRVAPPAPPKITMRTTLPEVSGNGYHRATAAAPMASTTLVSGPEQRILDAIAWLESLGINQPDCVPVAFLADYSPGGGSFNNARGKLNSRGLVTYPQPGRVALTEAGREVAAAPPEVATNADLQARVMSKIGGPERALLERLIARYPQAMTNRELAEAAGYTPGGGSFNNARGRLRSLGLIDYPQAGHAIALPLLFPKES